MARDGTPVRYTNFDGLLNNGVTDFLLQDNELYACKNVWAYKIGKLDKVPGYTRSANDTAFLADTDLTFLHFYYNTVDSLHYQIGGAFDGTNTIIKYRQNGGWSSVKATVATAADANLSAINLVGKAFIVGHDGTDFIDPISIKGTTYTSDSGADTDLVDMPKGKFITEFKKLLIVMNCRVAGVNYPSRVYYSEDVEGGVVQWVNATNFEPVGVDDGDVLVGGGEAVDRLIILKERSVWKMDSSMSGATKVSETGCDSAKSILTIENKIYWFNRHGFWAWDGSTPLLISERAKEYIDAIDPVTFGKVVATEYYKKEYRAFIGDVTVSNVLYKNAWFCYDTLRQRCYIRCTYLDVTAACKHMESDNTRAYFGSSDGNLYKFAEKADRVFSDAGKEIDSFFETRLLDHGVPEDVKFTNHMTVFTKNNSGMKVSVDADNAGTFVIDNEDTINQNVQQIEITASANRYRYRFYEKSDGLSWEFEGFVIDTQIKEDA